MPSVFSKKFHKEIAAAGTPPSGSATLTPPPRPTSSEDVAPEFAQDDASQLELALPVSGGHGGSDRVSDAAREQVASALAPVNATPPSTRWGGPEAESRRRRATTEDSALNSSATRVVARVTRTIAATHVSPRHEASPASSAPSARFATPLPELPDALDPGHVEAFHPFEDVKAYLSQDGKVWNDRELAAAKYVPAHGLWYSPGEAAAGLHLPLPPDEAPRKVTVACLRPGRDGTGTVSVHVTALRDSRGRIFTKEQWDAAYAAANPPPAENPLVAITNRIFRKRPA